MPNSDDVKIVIDGIEYVGWTAISKAVGVPRKTLSLRVKKKGWSLERAIDTPVSKKQNHPRPHIVIDGREYKTWKGIAEKIGISESLLRARVQRMGWSLSDAVNTPTSELGKTGNNISFQGQQYSTQENFVAAVADLSPFSKTTLKIKLGELRKQNPDFTEQDLENLVFGKNEIMDEGGFVYLITSLQTGKQYVGITIRTIKERWKAHQSECGDERIQSPLKSEMREYGFDNFTIEQIGRTDNSKSLKELETKEIKKRNTVFPNGLNSNIGGTLGARDVEVFEFEGIEYRSISDLARKKGIEPSTLNQRINSYGMSLKDAVYFEKDTSVELHGRTFSSISDLCEKLNLNYQRVRGLHASGYPLTEIFERLTKFVPCPICGSEFKRKSSLHKFCSEKCKWKNKELTKGQNSGSGNKREVTYEGQIYPSVSNFCKEHGLNRSTFNRSLIKCEGSVEKALEHYRNRKIKSN